MKKLSILLIVLILILTGCTNIKTGISDDAKSITDVTSTTQIELNSSESFQTVVVHNQAELQNLQNTIKNPVIVFHEGFEGILDSQSDEYFADYARDYFPGNTTFRLNSDSILVLPPIEKQGSYNDFNYVVHSGGTIQLISHTWTGNEMTIPDEIEGLPVCYIADGFINTNNTRRGNDYLEKLTLGNNIKVIGSRAFESCRKLKSMFLPESIIAIGDYAFYDIGSDSITITSNIKYLGDFSFSSEYIKNLKIEEGATFSTNSGIFERTNIESVEIPSSIDMTNEYELQKIFRYCKNLKTVTFSEPSNDSLIIPLEAFLENSKLENIIFPNNVIKIEYRAFSYCISLKAIKIPSSVKKIEEDAFIGCYGLKDIYFENADCDMSGCGLADHFVRIHAPAGGTVEEYCKQNFFNKFVPTT